MMDLKERLANDLKDAMREKNQLKKSVITMLRAAIKQSEVDNRIELDDSSIIELIQKQLKQKRSANEEFEKASRTDLVDETNGEISILMTYLPTQLTQDELEVIIKDALDKTAAASMKDMGKVMAHIKDSIAGKADNKLVSEIIKKMLNN
jgi:uncharacterized protein YqeY